jgi:hypothetical protein
MSAEPTGKRATSLLESLMSRQKPWMTACISLLLILVPPVCAYLDGEWDSYIGEGVWRIAYLPVAVIIYILIVAPLMARMDANVVESFRPLVLIDDAEFDRLVAEASPISPLREMLAFGVGAAFGLWAGLAGFSRDAVWLSLSFTLFSSLMFGLLGWTIYGAVAGTRLISELHRQPLRIDIFDIEPFEPIGRQSLIIALVFVGGLLLSVLFGLGRRDFLAWPNWLVYIFLGLVPVVVFFLNMRGTHRVLAAEKKRQLKAIEGIILQSCRTLLARIHAGQDTGTLGDEINALVAYEQRLQAARTWPYNTAMLRTLFFSVIIPGGAALVEFAFKQLF